MDIEEIKLKVTLKSGEKVWDRGTILNAPFDPIIVEEIRAGASTFEVRRRTGEPEHVDSPATPQADAIIQQKAAELESKDIEIDELKIKVAQLQGRINVLEESIEAAATVTASDDPEPDTKSKKKSALKR